MVTTDTVVFPAMVVLTGLDEFLSDSLLDHARRRNAMVTTLMIFAGTMMFPTMIMLTFLTEFLSGNSLLNQKRR